PESEKALTPDVTVENVPPRFSVDDVSLMLPAFCQVPLRLSVPLDAAMPPALLWRLVTVKVPPVACSDAGPLPGPLLVTDVPVTTMLLPPLAVTAPLTVSACAA